MKLFLTFLAVFILTLIGCDIGGGGSIPPSTSDGPFSIRSYAGSFSVYSDVAENPYRNKLSRCLDIRNVCSLRDLSFIGMESTPPTIEEVMNRLVVSHAWMGRRFEEVLRFLSPDTQSVLLQLFQSVTAVVIGSEIRPSHYRRSNSVIYLDPLQLALTAEEASVVNQEPDYRTNFGADLMFAGVWRYATEDNEYFYDIVPGITPEEATLENTSRYFARLLFHELAHANDFYPHDLISIIPCTDSHSLCDVTDPSRVRLQDPDTGEYIAFNISRQFGYADPAPNYHLSERNMLDYASVRYHGRGTTGSQLEISGAEIGGNWVANDAANHDYAYTSPAEDVAMLVEGVLVKHLFNADMDIAYIDRPDSGNVNQYMPIAWGVRGRIGNPPVTLRAQHLLELMLPEVIPNSFFANIDPERPMQTDCGWLDNLDLICANMSIESGPEGQAPSRKPRSIFADTRNPHY